MLTIIVVLSILILISAFTWYFFKVKRIRIKIRKFSKSEILKFIWGSIIGTIILGWIGQYLYGYIFPAPEKELIEMTQTILSQNDSSFKALNNLIQNGNINAEKIEKLIQRLPNLGSDTTDANSLISQWYNKGNINYSEKDLLNVVVKQIFAYGQQLELKQEQLYKVGFLDLSNSIRNIHQLFCNKNSEGIADYYFSIKHNFKKPEHKIRLVHFAIGATERLFAFNSTKILYQELISLSQVPEHYQMFALFLSKYNQDNEAINNYKKAINLSSFSIKTDSLSHFYNLATCYNDLATIYIKRGEYSFAEVNLKKSIEYFSRISIKNDMVSDIGKSIALINLANIAAESQQYDKAIKLNYSAVNELEKHVRKDSIHIYELTIHTFDNIAKLYIDKNVPDSALFISNIITRWTLGMFNSDRVKYAPLLARVMCTHGIVMSNNNLSVDAYKAFELSNSFYALLVKNNPIVFDYEYAHLCMKYGIFLRKEKDLSRAKQKYDIALEILRKLYSEDPKSYGLKLVRQLRNHGNLLVELNQKQSACRTYKEALKIVELLQSKYSISLESEISLLNNNLKYCN